MSTDTSFMQGATAYTRPDRDRTSSFDPGTVSAFDQGESASTTWADLINSLLDVRNLKEDWDGEGAEAPNPVLVDAALTLAQCLQAQQHRPADRVIAGVNGTVYFEWHLPTGYLELEVIHPELAEWRFVHKGSNITEVFTLRRR